LKLQGKRILVTGGTRGIGRAIVDRIIAEGAARVVVASEVENPENPPAGVDYFKCDTGSEDEPTQLVRDAHEKMGGLDGLVHCAGVYPEAKPGEKSRVQLWNESVNIKARGGYLLALEFVKLATPGASFVGVTSINAIQSEPDHLAYDPACAAFGGVIRSFAVHYAPNFRFNALAPGLIHTQLTDIVAATPAFHQHACENIPLGRMGKPEECAGAAVFLLSDDSAYITGDTIFVDGGIQANQMSKPKAG
jgi:NAD(P)-dependent dehydrogenase (short-subunit alcohol dehydrogenase family)